MLKIGLIVHCPSPHQKVWLDEISGVPETDVVVAYAYPDDQSRAWGMHKAIGRTVQVPPIHGFGGGRRLKKWVADLDRDVWVLGSSFTYAPTQALATAFTELRLPWAFLGEPPRPRAGLRGVVRDWMLHRILRRCHGVIGTGVEPARRYRALLGDDRPVMSVPYYIPLDEWLSLPAVAPPTAGEALRFLTLAQLIPRKGIDVLIEAGTLLPPSGWRLDVYGDGTERPRLQRAIAARGLPIQLHPPLAFSERSEPFRTAHCFVFPSRWDGWGMAPVEALAAGLPVIATDQTMSAYEFIRNEVNGWIVPCKAGAIAGAMRAVISRPERLPVLSAAARTAVSGYDPKTGAAEFVQFCRYLSTASWGRKPAA
jgi:glycosyltransferase involved in cell wall biosynthesis